jgi:hypothetical protein
MATGFVSDNPALDLVVVLPNGLVRSAGGAHACAQVIHNSPSPTVDVYLDGDQVLNDFAFREATEVGAAAGPRAVRSGGGAGKQHLGERRDLHPAGRTGLEIGKTYVIMAAGVVGDPTTPFQLYVNADGRDRAAERRLRLTSRCSTARRTRRRWTCRCLPEWNTCSITFRFRRVLELRVGACRRTTPCAGDAGQRQQHHRAVVHGRCVEPWRARPLRCLPPVSLSGQPGFEVWVALADGTTFPLPVFVSTNDLDGKLQSLRLAPNPAVSETWVRFDLTEGADLTLCGARRDGPHGCRGRLRVGAGRDRLPSAMEVGTLPARDVQPGSALGKRRAGAEVCGIAAVGFSPRRRRDAEISLWVSAH